jgi:hypothetical protein
VQEVVIEKLRVAQQEKDSLQTEFEEEKEQIHEEKENLLVEHIGVKEAVSRELRFMTGLEKKVEEPIEHQVV